MGDEMTHSAAVARLGVLSASRAADDSGGSQLGPPLSSAADVTGIHEVHANVLNGAWRPVIGSSLFVSVTQDNNAWCSISGCCLIFFPSVHFCYFLYYLFSLVCFFLKIGCVKTIECFFFLLS